MTPEKLRFRIDSKPFPEICNAQYMVQTLLKPCSRHVVVSRCSGSLKLVPTGNNAKRLSSVNYITKSIHHHHHLYYHHLLFSLRKWVY